MLLAFCCISLNKTKIPPSSFKHRGCFKINDCNIFTFTWTLHFTLKDVFILQVFMGNKMDFACFDRFESEAPCGYSFGWYLTLWIYADFFFFSILGVYENVSFLRGSRELKNPVCTAGWKENSQCPLIMCTYSKKEKDVKCDVFTNIIRHFPASKCDP